MVEDINPVDDYLLKLQQQKQRVEQMLPGLVEGVNKTFGTNVQIPNGIPLNFKAQQAVGGNQGRVNFAPGMNTPKASPAGTSDFVKNLLAGSMIPGAIPESDAYQRVKQIGFGSSTNKNNFDRYYNHPMYKQLGWNPHADNEAIYNANSTWVDDWSRATSQWGSLASLGFKQTLGNWDDLFTLNTEGDTHYAREMNKMMSIANSTRGGLGGFATNLYANSAYTFGVIGEAVTEEIGLWGATALTGGALGEAALLRTATLGKRMSRAAELLEKGKNFLKGTKNVDEILTTLNTALNSVDDVSNAKKFWNGVADFVNPVSETTDVLRKIRTGEDGFDKLSDFAKNAKTFGGFFRDLKMANTTLAESRLEGGMVENDVFDQLYNKWMTDHDGKGPTGKDADTILAQAKLAGTRTTMFNAPAIFFSNKLVFEKMLNGFKPFRELRGGLGEMVIDFGAINKPGKKVFQGFIDPKFYKAFYKKEHFKHYIGQFKPKNLLKNGLRYASANLAEGLQESYQEAISSGMKNYFIETYASPERAGTAYMMQHLGKGFGDQFSGQGAETFLSGFLMGGVVQGPQSLLFQTAPQAVGKAYNKMFDKEAYEQQQEREVKRKTQQESITNFLNEVQADPRKFYDKIYGNMQSQKDFSNLMTDAEAAGDQKQHKDAKNDSIFTHVSTLLESGYIDLFTDQIESFKSMDDKDLAEAFSYSDTQGNKDQYNKDVRSRLDSVLGKVNQIKGLYDKYSTIKNPYNLKSNDPFEVMDHQGFEFGRRLAIYNEYTFDQNVKRISNILSDASANGLGKVSGSALTFLFSQSPLERVGYSFSNIPGTGIKKSRLELEIGQLEEEAKTYAEGNAEQKKIGEEKLKLAGQLRQFQEDFNQYVDSYSNAKSSALSEERSTQHKENITLGNRIVEGSNVEHTFKNGTKVTGTVVKKNGSKITIEYQEGGKTVRKQVSANSKKLNILAGPQNTVEESENVLETHLEQRRDNLAASLREYLSSVSGLPVDSTQFDKLIGHMVDYAELGTDAKDAMTVVNMLNNPEKFSLAAQAFSQGKKDAFAIAQANLKKSLEEYKRRMATNDLLKNLYYKFNVFISPEDIQKLTIEDKYPTAFYEMDVKTKEISPISPTSDKYAAILDYLGEESEKEGTTLKGRPFVQSPDEVFFYDVTPVEKALTLSEILNGLGLKPGQKNYTVNVVDVINYVLAERAGSIATRKILQKFLTTLDPQEKMVISLGEKDGFSYKKETGFVLDPRFATRDYSFEMADGKNVTATLGYLVLNGLTQMVVNQNLNDSQFQTAIDEVMEAVTAYTELNPQLPQEIKLNLEYAMQSREKFMSLALSNAAFQTYLSQVPYENKNTNLWKQIIKSIAALINKLFKTKVPVTENALEEVLGIMSNKVEGKDVQAATPITKVQKTDKQGVTINTPLADIEQDHPDLYNKLYVVFNEESIKQGKARPIDELEDWIKEGSQVVEDLFEAYNNLNNLSIAPEEQARITKAKQDKKEANRLKFFSTVEQADAEILDILSARIDNAKYREDNGITYKEGKQAIANRKAELKQALPNFETINTSQILLMKDDNDFNIPFADVSKNYDPSSKTVTIMDTETGDEYEMTREQYEQQVEEVMAKDEIDEDLEVGGEEESTPEETEISNTNAEASAEQEETYYNDLDSKADVDNKEDIKNDLLNNLGC
jgi:hypothetical protein